MVRVIVPPETIQEQTIAISDPHILHHLRKVLRLRLGETLECADGTGLGFSGKIIEANSHRLTVQIERRWKEPQAIKPVILAQSLIKPERFEWVLQKATELGVSRIIPLLTERTLVRQVQQVSSHRLSRWRTIIQEAASQCQRATVPILESPQLFEQAIRTLSVPPTPQKPLLLMPTLAILHRKRCGWRKKHVPQRSFPSDASLCARRQPQSRYFRSHNFQWGLGILPVHER
ncbi:MAG: 16S rRNA (uracil(1498)-N(3))-methyltransferase [Candidatus Omnitrophica bacterium]|nr:16S rRNA (uracil(1498)-N(3))-methyltransferase [Candidatus Omnitrophota bacterium]